jgi:hypothetical protein
MIGQERNDASSYLAIDMELKMMPEDEPGPFKSVFFASIQFLRPRADFFGRQIESGPAISGRPRVKNQIQASISTEFRAGSPSAKPGQPTCTTFVLPNTL